MNASHHVLHLDHDHLHALTHALRADAFAVPVAPPTPPGVGPLARFSAALAAARETYNADAARVAGMACDRAADMERFAAQARRADTEFAHALAEVRP